MEKPFKFRYVNEIVGTVVILIVSLLLVGLFLVVKSHDWFVPNHNVVVEFPTEGTLGLQVGAQVRVLGAVAGRVAGINADKAGKLTGVIDVKGDFIHLVRTDSIATVKQTAIGAGDFYLDISQGSGPELPVTVALQCEKGEDIFNILEGDLQEFHEEVLPVLTQINGAAEEYRNWVAELRGEEAHLHQFLVEIGQVVATLQKEQGGTMERSARDPAVAGETGKVLRRIDQAVEELQRVMEDMEAASSRVPSTPAKVGGDASAMPEIAVQLQDRLKESQRLLEGIQKQCPIRDHSQQSGAGESIPASRVPNQGGIQ